MFEDWERLPRGARAVTFLVAALVLGLCIAAWTAPGLGCRLENYVRAEPKTCTPADAAPR